MARNRLAAAAVCIGAVLGAGTGVQAQQNRTGGGWIRIQPEERPAQQPRGAGGALTPEQRRNLANHGADVAAPLDAGGVARAAQAWRVNTQANVTHAPLVDGGRVYFAAWDCNVYCVDLRTGREVWRKRFGEPNQAWPWHGFAGTGVIGDGVLFEASAEGKAYAINTENGELLWEADIAEDEHAGNAGPLLYHNGLVYIGLSSVEDFLSANDKNLTPDSRGRVMALDAGTGNIVWEADLVREPSNGVPVRGGFALDPDLGDGGALYFTTGTNFTGRPSALSDAVVAVEARTGELLWHHQTQQGDVWTARNPEGPGFGFVTPPQLFNATIDGERRLLVGAGQKSGVYHVLDRETGEPVWQAHVGYGNIGGGITAPASVGRDRLLVWGNNSFAFTDPERRAMTVAALDGQTGRYVWVRSSAQAAGFRGAGYLAGDVYFVPSLDGRVRAFSAEDGRDVWASEEHAAVGSPVVVSGGMLLFGTGVPGEFGGADQAEKGVHAYRLGAGPAGEDPAVRPASLRQRGEGARQPLNLEPLGERPAGARARAEEAERVVKVEMRDMRYEPSIIRAKPGERVRIHLSNTSSMRHGATFILPGGDQSLEAPLSEDEESELVITAPREPGEYWFYCPLHREQMRGRLVVEEVGDIQGPRNIRGTR